MPLVGTLDLEIVRWKSVYYTYKHIYIYVKYYLYERIIYIYTPYQPPKIKHEDEGKGLGKL